MTEISDTANFLDVRDIIERVEELREERDSWVLGAPDGTETPNPGGWAKDNPDEVEELAALEKLLNGLAGSGGDHEWEGAWYPVTLIRDGYFEDYAREFAVDIGAVDRNAAWPLQHLDWKAAAEALQQDYQMIDFGESTYWYR